MSSLNFVDFRQAFDSMHRGSLWNIIQLYGVLAKMTRIVNLLHSDTQCCICHESRQLDWFNVVAGVKQGCVMAGFLFILIIDYVMR